ncbi:MAG: hypothetical protein L0H63_14260, partial [Nitrococcus sp.]|nr:hypothetical protein [Nitrococcus sp.]
MTRKRRSQRDLIEQEIELVLNPGAFIPDRACFSFVSDLDEVTTKIAKLVSSDPGRAVTLYETFLAACYAKIEELDDSSGSFGQFIGELYCRWIKARIVNAKKSKYYDAALSNFERAKRCFEQAGLDDEWNKTVRQVRADHQRKNSFMPGFERLVAGMATSDNPS